MRSLLTAAWIVVSLFVPPPARLAADPGERSLHAYANDDGSKPDGANGKRDDTSALRKALAAGPGVVRIGKGYYRLGDVEIPEGVTVAGMGKATVLRSNGAAAIFRQVNAGDWAIRDLVLDGEASGDWRKRKDAGKSGLFTEGCWNFEVVGVTARNFDGAGFQLTRTKGHDGGRLDRLTARGCYIGIRFDLRAEYFTAAQLNCQNNVTGCVVHAGNTSISTSNFSDNVDGMVIEDKDNGSHGAISNCLFNHNDRFCLLARKAKNGMAIGNCCFFYGTLRIEDSTGVNITSSLVSCAVRTEGKTANRFAGNHLIPLQFQFSFSPADIIEGNFTKDGPWKPPARR